jgi:hypothetical protein
MAKVDRPAMTLDNEDDERLHATWTRTGRLVLTVTDPRFRELRQVALRSDQVEELIKFLEAGSHLAGDAMTP